MEISAFKKAIIEKLEGLNEAQLIEVQELIENFHQQENIEEPQTDYHLEEWDLMPDWQKKRIEDAEKSLGRAAGVPHKEVARKVKEICPTCSKNDVWRIIKDNNLKNNFDYSKEQEFWKNVSPQNDIPLVGENKAFPIGDFKEFVSMLEGWIPALEGRIVSNEGAITKEYGEQVLEQ